MCVACKIIIGMATVRNFDVIQVRQKHLTVSEMK